MPVQFPTGRERSLAVSGSLFARYAYHPELTDPVALRPRDLPRRGLSRFESLRATPSLAWSGAQVRAALRPQILRAGGPAPYPRVSTDTFGVALDVTVGSGTQSFYYDSGVPVSASDYDIPVSVDLVFQGPAREIKRVTEHGDYPGGVVDFTPRTTLEYGEEWAGPVTLTATGDVAGTHPFPVSGTLFWPEGYTLDLRAEHEAGFCVLIPSGTTWNRRFYGEAARASALGVAGAPLWHTSGSQVCSSDYWSGEVGKTGDESFVSAAGRPVSVTAPPGMPAAVELAYSGSAFLSAAPALAWQVSGSVRQWTDAYPSAQVDDLTADATRTADSEGAVSGSAEIHSYSWKIEDDITDEPPDTAQDAASETPDGYRLNADWLEQAGEDADDWRVTLDDDHAFDAFRLRHEGELVLDPLDSTDGWEAASGGAAFWVDGGLKVLATEDDTRIAKGGDSRLMHYRYLRLRLKADAAPVPVRVWLGERYWDVLIEEPDTVEEKILDLSAAHNAESFDDIRGVGDIDSLAFDGLLADVTYWFTDLTLLRRHSALATALPAFQDDYRVLTVEVDRKPSLELPYYDDTSGSLSLGQLVGRIDASGTGWGYTVEEISGTHSYYNRDRYAAYLEDAFDRDVTDLTVFQARPRFDVVAGYPGIGDPSQPYGAGPFVLRFTKRLRGKLDGLVYIRDLTPSGTLHTRVQASGSACIADTQWTDDWRWYRTVPLPAGTYEVVRIDEDGEEWMRGERAVTNRSLGRQHLQAQVIDYDTRQPISGAEVNAELLESIQYGDIDYSQVSVIYGVTNAAGLYTVPNLRSIAYDVSIVTPDGGQGGHDAVLMQSPHRDGAYAVRGPATIRGQAQYAETGDPLGGAEAGADQAESRFAAFQVEVAGPDGTFTIVELSAVSRRSVDHSYYTVWLDHGMYSACRRIPDVEASSGGTTDIGVVGLEATGAIEGRVWADDEPAAGVLVHADQAGGLGLGSGECETDAMGYYSIPMLDAPGGYVVTAQRAVGGLVVRQSVAVSVQPGSTSEVPFTF